jgi:phage shock protein E
MSNSPLFEKLCSEARSRIREVSPLDAAKMQSDGAILIDVREAADFEKNHATGAIHLSKGVIEMKIEQQITNLGATIVCYCGGGNRSALTADNLQKMGYTDVSSMAGGFKKWEEQGLPTTS